MSGEAEMELEQKEGHFIAYGGHVHIWAFVTICLYLLHLLGLGVFSYVKNAFASSQTGDATGAYFLAGRSFGTLVTFLTLFASLFSGFTVVFVPLETAWAGFGKASRWLTIAAAICLCPSIYSPGFRILGVERKHHTLTEFYTDRWRSTTLTTIYVFALGGAALPYICAQFVALKGTVETLTGSVQLGEVSMVTFAYFIFTLEVFGGMRGVALSDALQSAVMIVTYMIVPFLLLYHYGGFNDLIPPGCMNGEPGVNPFSSSYLMCALGNAGSEDGDVCDTDGCFSTCGDLDYFACTTSTGTDSRTATDCDAINGNYNSSLVLPCTTTHPAFAANRGGCSGCLSSAGTLLGDPGKLVRHPHAWQGDYQVWKSFSAPFSLLVGGPAPLYWTRYVSARSSSALKYGTIILGLTPFAMFVASFYIGAVWMANHGPQFITFTPKPVIVSTFGGILDDLMDLGGFAEAVSVILGCAAVAAFMSTADSIKWGDSDGNLVLGGVTLSLQTQTIVVSKIVSFFIITFCVYWAMDNPDLGGLFGLFFGLLAVSGPGCLFGVTKFFGLSERATAPPLIIGALAALITHFGILIPMRNTAIEEGRPPPETIVTYDVFALIVNWIVTIPLCFLFPASVVDPPEDQSVPAWLAWDRPVPEVLAAHGERYLTWPVAENILSKRKIPSNTKGWTFIVGGFFLAVLSMPWLDGGGECKGAENGVPAPGSCDESNPYLPPMPETYVMGLPGYVAFNWLGSFVGSLIGIVGIYFYWEDDDTDVSGLPVLKKVIERMSVDDVCEWLTEVDPDFEKYVPGFREHQITGQALQGMRYEHITDCGVKMVGHAIKIEEGIKTLKSVGWLGPAPQYVSLYTPDSDVIVDEEESNNPTFEEESGSSMLANTNRTKSEDLG